MIVVRADSAYDAGAFVAACRHGAHFSVTVRMDSPVPPCHRHHRGGCWTPIKYPNAIFDDQAGEWISDAEIAEVPYTASPPTAPTAPTGR
jgi:hypothetical protein